MILENKLDTFSGRITFMSKRHETAALTERKWSAIGASHRGYWAEQIRRHGPGAALEVAHALRQHMKSINPDWPSPRDREKDLDGHLRLKKQLDRAANGRTPR